MISKRQLSPVSNRGEYLPIIPPAKKRSGRGLWSSLVLAMLTVMTVFLLLTVGRQWYDSVLARIDQQKKVHPDESIADSGVHSQVSPQITLVYKNQAGKPVRSIINAQQYSAFVNQQIANLEAAKQLLLTQATLQLQRPLTTIFAEMKPRIDKFADWYFAYPTTYKILWEASLSATRHTFSVEAMSLSEAVAYDVEKYLYQHYENIVLRPELTDPKLQQVFRQALQQAHHQYLLILSQLQTDFQALVARQTTHFEEPLVSKIELQLDWESQLNKITLAEYEKTVESGTLGAALVAGGAVAGKMIAGAAGKTVATATSKGVLAKLSAPFVSKAVLAGGGGVVGSLGGPMGAVVGTAAGLGIDYVLNESVELTQREGFIAEVNAAVSSTQAEWEKTMQQAVQTAINIWLEDTIQLLPRYQPPT